MIIGKANKVNGTWILKPFGFKNLHVSGKHHAEAHLGNNTYLCLMRGIVRTDFTFG